MPAIQQLRAELPLRKARVATGAARPALRRPAASEDADSSSPTWPTTLRTLWEQAGMRGRLRPGGGGRLWPGQAVSAFRCRRAVAAARRRTARGRPELLAAHRDLHRQLLGHRAGDRLQRAHRVPMPGRGRQGRDGPDLGAGFAPGHRQHARLYGQLRDALGEAMDPRAFFCRQDAGNAPAPQQVRRHAVRAGAQLQGVARRPARPADAAVGVQGRRHGQELGRTGPHRPGHAARSAPDQAQRSPDAA